jgi:hypothetical protein
MRIRDTSGILSMIIPVDRVRSIAPLAERQRRRPFFSTHYNSRYNHNNDDDHKTSATESHLTTTFPSSSIVITTTADDDHGDTPAMNMTPQLRHPWRPHHHRHLQHVEQQQQRSFHASSSSSSSSSFTNNNNNNNKKPLSFGISPFSSWSSFSSFPTSSDKKIATATLTTDSGSRSSLPPLDYEDGGTISSSSTSSFDVQIVEVSPRDGLQNESSNTVTTADKIQLIQYLAHAGCSTIEMGSFVSPKWVPAMADSDIVLQAWNDYYFSSNNETETETDTNATTSINDVGPAAQQEQQQPQDHLFSVPSPPPLPPRSMLHHPVRCSVLIPNLQGLQRALAIGTRATTTTSGNDDEEESFDKEHTTGHNNTLMIPTINEVAIAAVASDMFAQRNWNCKTGDELIQRACLPVAQAVHEYNSTISHNNDNNTTTKTNKSVLQLRGYISCVIGCPYQGPVKPLSVAKVVEQLVYDLECTQISLGDTIGVGTPTTIRAMLTEVQVRDHL